jgi:Rieske 2Fe-2S family protein
MAVHVEERAKVRVHPAIPARDFYDPRVFDLERERIFYRNWVCMGLEEELPNVGDFLVRDVLGESILIVRGRDARVRAFYNVCRHRGSRLRSQEAGNLPGVVQCPYHAWTYSLRGELVGTPNVHDVEGFDRADYPLHAIALETW